MAARGRRNWRPGRVPRILGEDAQAGAFAMEYLAPAAHPVWKNELRDGNIRTETAAAVARVIAAIHAGTAQRADIAQRFANDHIFHPIRLEPYLLATAAHHPDCAARLHELAETTARTKLALVHGDLSPKNILVGGARADICSTPNAPGTATRPSTSPSASTICC